MLQNYRQAENLLGEKKDKTDPDKSCPTIVLKSIDVSLEDLRLGFPDKEDGIKLSHLVPFKDERCRSSELQRLSGVKNRFIITYGDAASRDDDTEQSLADQVRKYNSEHNPSSHMFVRHKPLADIYTLGRQAKLYNLWRKTRDQNAETIKNEEQNKGKPSNHSAEGIIIDIAEILFGRAKKLLREEKSIQDIIHAALLALEAKELLGGKTPTISLELLDLQHQAEVLAECRCYGTNYNKQTVSRRIAEIKKEVYLICQWYRPGSQRLASLSARSKIVGGLSKIFADARQIEEHETTLVETRRLSGLLFVHHNRWALPLYPLRWYFELLQRSLAVFTFIVMSWFLFFVFLWSWNFGQSLGESAYLVFNQLWERGEIGVGQSHFLTQFLRFFPFVIGSTHVVVLISSVHSRIQRK